MQRYHVKLLAVSLLFLCLLPVRLPAALPFYINWEVRPSAGNDNNGGGFVSSNCSSPGTDWSQQNSPQYAITTATTAGASATFATALAAADMVCNVLQVISGTNFTTGFYQIISVVAGVSVTVDRNIATGVGASGVINIGGALATLPKAVTASQVQELSTIYIKNTGTVTLTSVQTLAFNLTAVIGYGTTRTDGTRVTITTSTNSVSLFTNNGAIFNFKFQNINFTNTAGTPLYAYVSSNTNASGPVFFDNCSFSGFSSAVRGDNNVNFQINHLVFTNSEIKNSVLDGIFNTNGVLVVAGSYIHDNGGAGIHVSANGGGYGGTTTVIHSIIKSNTLSGILNSNGNVPTGVNDAYHWNSIYNSALISNGRSGIEITNTGTDSLIAWNNIFYANTRYGIETQQSATDPYFLISALMDGRSNAFRLNGIAQVLGFPAGTGTISLTADPFVSQAGNNFALNSTAGGGAALKGLGFPGTLAIGGTGAIDIGPLQSTAAAAAGQKAFGFTQ
jgi:hypothetical protein